LNHAVNAQPAIFKCMKRLTSFAAAAAFSLGIALAQEGQTVNVTMTEYKFEMPTTAKAGKTTFVIKNAGKRVHNFQIKGEGISEKLPVNPKPQQTQTLQVELKPGTYAITCPVDFHTQKGMKTTLTVK
jgi:uncharacterized cupredoxin-like copper-binding protein